MFKKVKKIKFIMILVVFIIFTFGLTTAASAGNNHNASQLERAGWNCVVAGSHGWIHCFPPGSNNETTIQVKVFGETGAPFLGAEILVNASVYNGQVCATDGGNAYTYLGDDFPYYACHLFNTGS